MHYLATRWCCSLNNCRRYFVALQEVHVINGEPRIFHKRTELLIRTTSAHSSYSFLSLNLLLPFLGQQKQLPFYYLRLYESKWKLFPNSKGSREFKGFTHLMVCWRGQFRTFGKCRIRSLTHSILHSLNSKISMIYKQMNFWTRTAHQKI